jgi:quercetin dioxygenase-like cupin family protein
VITAKPNELELLKFWQESDPTAGIKINFPIDAQTGAASTAAVYFELDPEQHIGRHTHSAKEILFVLEGEAEAVVGDERGRLSKEEMAVVPANVPHDLYNVGEGTLRVVGFFSSAAVVTIFDDPLALRKVRAWLEPYVMLMRYWRAFSDLPPPAELKALLEWVFAGKGLYLYAR